MQSAPWGFLLVTLCMEKRNWLPQHDGHWYFNLEIETYFFCLRDNTLTSKHVLVTTCHRVEADKRLFNDAPGVCRVHYLESDRPGKLFQGIWVMKRIDRRCC